MDASRLGKLNKGRMRACLSHVGQQAWVCLREPASGSMSQACTLHEKPFGVLLFIYLVGLAVCQLRSTCWAWLMHVPSWSTRGIQSWNCRQWLMICDHLFKDREIVCLPHPRCILPIFMQCIYNMHTVCISKINWIFLSLISGLKYL